MARITRDPYVDRIRGLTRVLVVAPTTGVFASAIFQCGLLPDRCFRVTSLEQAATIRAAWAQKNIRAAVLDLGLSDVPPDEDEEVPAPVKPEKAHAKGERTGSAKLTEHEVREIRELAASGITSKALAARYGVAKATIELAVTRKTWASVP